MDGLRESVFNFSPSNHTELKNEIADFHRQEHQCSSKDSDIFFDVLLNNYKS
jgi:hypothetical protein